MLQQLREGFEQAFSTASSPRFFYAPGRVNLIGEHIDYNGGFVFPCALNLGTYAAISLRKDNIINLVSANIEPLVSVSVNNLTYDLAHSWANYPKGVAAQLINMGHKLSGFDLYILGNLPNSAGLSSSASMSVLTATALNTLFNLGVDTIEIARLCQRVENEYIGVNCGIMDMFASAMAKKDHALLLDCATLKYQQVPLKLGEYCLIIANTNNRRELADSKYNERRAECESALAQLQKVTQLNALCDLSPDEFSQHEKVIESDVERKRALHAVTENARTISAVEALNNGNLQQMGQLMNASHDSLRDHYEVTGVELDALVEAARTFDSSAVLGSRMTGAGFGGCTVSIVRQADADAFINAVGKAYTAKTGLSADFYVVQTSDGACEIHA